MFVYAVLLFNLYRNSRISGNEMEILFLFLIFSLSAHFLCFFFIQSANIFNTDNVSQINSYSIYAQKLFSKFTTTMCVKGKLAVRCH